MKPKYVVYECEECGREFYREVAETITDDMDDCHVRVQLLPEYGKDDIEEFPMCPCLGGDVAHVCASDEVAEDEIEVIE